MARNTLVGPWDGVLDFLGNLQTTNLRVAQIGLSKAATEYARVWKRGVESNQFGLMHKSELTLASMGGKSTPLVWKRKYVVGIKKTPTGNRSSYYFIGIAGPSSLVKIAVAQEYGYTIKSKKRCLAIPVTARARRYGSPNDYPWPNRNKRKRGNNAGKARGIFIPYRGGNKNTVGGLYVRGKKKTDKPELVYLLKRSVKLPVRAARAISWTIFKDKVLVIVGREMAANFQKKFNSFVKRSMYRA